MSMTKSIETSDPSSKKPGLSFEEMRNAETYTSRELFRDKTEIRIEHHGEIYRLRITRSGGLLLNK
jgi:hemin uptake protein HemP